ncbi:hypothetical protein JYK00_02645 [Thermosipho ferrireducens]|uniref:Uncharacterized protein n=1 Tax=Thermosipho ferrireducens TaxID=2571116 RepID=A0ABX7S768_9BACT|nr:hypothetical protein [Thermosipho ferrireducens]QTA38441.1 hypothetical protein JYK00_02645 [Thermosipho ferrireducens]
MKDEELYFKVLKAINSRTCYKPGTLLEDKIIKEISRKRKNNFFKTFVIALLVTTAATFMLVDLISLKNKNSEVLYSSSNIEQQIPKKFEPIYNISLVSDGF